MARKKKTTIDNNLSEKVQVAKQTYTEDTFTIGAENEEEPVIIENIVKKKSKTIIPSEELVELYTFKNKLNKIKVRVEYEKSFSFLFDFINATKLYKTYYTNEIDDEYDLLLLYTVLEFKKKMAKKQLSYAIYQKIELYFESLKSLYGRFKRADNTQKEALNLELDQMVNLSSEISYYFFK